MADISDVLNVLSALAAQAIYPNGTGAPSIVGFKTLIYVGWPDAGTLDADMMALSSGAPNGRLHVSIYPRAEEKKTTRYVEDWIELNTTAVTLTLAVAGQAVTVGGVVSVPQNVAILASDKAYTYAVQASDTLTSIATALAALVPGASSAGAVLTLPAGARIGAARAGTNGTLVREIRRQQRSIQITVWCHAPGARDAAGIAIDAALAKINFITLPDQSTGRLIYQSSPYTDGSQKSALYRRDLIYTVEYPTTETATATGVVVGQDNLNSSVAGSTFVVGTTITYQ